ncbi:hypothetical protein BRD17_09980 [Halobacteriales archaeon SW_7_68_16]|nr:MAG: hypothetical protein BRD17_09980 [Halobacteriales archaeon SW_7_68_16]
MSDRSSPTPYADDYYDRLGVDPDATRAEIEAAYECHLASMHPDVNDYPNPDEAFTRFDRAAGVLTDPHSREAYDVFRERPGIDDPATAFERWDGRGQTEPPTTFSIESGATAGETPPDDSSDSPGGSTDERREDPDTGRSTEEQREDPDAGGSTEGQRGDPDTGGSTEEASDDVSGSETDTGTEEVWDAGHDLFTAVPAAVGTGVGYLAAEWLVEGLTAHDTPGSTPTTFFLAVLPLLIVSLPFVAFCSIPIAEVEDSRLGRPPVTTLSLLAASALVVLGGVYDPAC